MSGFNDDLYPASSVTGDAIAPRPVSQSVTDIKNDKDVIQAQLAPAQEVLNDVIKKEIERVSDIRSYLAKFTTTNPNGDDIYVEYRAREDYVKFLEKFKQLVNAGLGGEKS